jgi:peptide chain release factor 2
LIDAISGKIQSIKTFSNFEKKCEELCFYEALIADPSTWNDVKKANELAKKKASLQEEIEQISLCIRQFSDLRELLDMAKEGGDEQVFNECITELQKLAADVEHIHLVALLSEEADSSNCFLEINSGAGGTEAQDWVAMLARMYSRWAERRGFSLEVVDEMIGEEAGFKSISMKISGLRAYGWLKTENGVHRLVRISPFDANARRHTSFASVWTYPETNDDIDIKIEEKDLRIDTYRASGAGGQHVNKTDSAIRITHIPTGIITQSQVDRSQHRNRAMAMALLRARLYELEMRKKQAFLAEQEKNKTDIAWGNQIRSYVLQPYQLVKDSRTGVEVGNAYGVLDGDIDKFLEASLVASKTGRDGGDGSSD